MPKSEVYSWRLSPALKEALEEAARIEGRSLGGLLEGIVEEWLRRSEGKGTMREKEEEERRRQRALRFAGAIRGGDPRRAERAKQTIRAKLKRQHAR